MSVTSHLKDLLTKMGGTPKDGDSTSVLIDKIEDVYDGSSEGGSAGVSSYNDLTDRPFDVTKDYTVLFEETVTAEESPDGICSANLAYAEIVNNDSIKVTVDGVEYSCEKYTADATVAPEGSAFYGAGLSVSDSGLSVDFSEYPFCMGSVPTNVPRNTLLLQNPGTHTIKVETYSSDNITTTDDFEKAVNSVQNCSNSFFIITRYVDEVKDSEIVGETIATFKLDKTVNEIRSACEKGIPIYMRDDTTSVKIIDYRSGAYDYPTFVPKTNTSALLSSSGCTSTTTRNVRLCTNEFAASWLQENVDDFCYAGQPILVSTVAAETVPNSGKLAGLKITTSKETLDFNCNAGSVYPWYEQDFGYDVEG